ncbi:hypothetical protein F5144DRAFT_603843 [Chaetomium tenue]|uniref:Uncharacterized protein n=1 Tax=Chaetomium tenue TaxID=1854479 RepID=A0ACB7P0T4_9PEZI|nr:hypothetical protein F5144DRAFT_603843 [Chaetomium globosum]
MAVIYDGTFQCMNCGLFPAFGTLYRCILDRESLIQDAYDDGFSAAFDFIGCHFEKEMSLGKSGPDVRSEPDSSPRIEMSEEQLSSYTPEQLSILESQRNNVRNTIANERSILEHLTPECARDKYPYDAKPLGYERTWVSLNSVLNEDIPPNVATGFSFSFARERPVCDANVVRNIGVRPSPLPPHHPAMASEPIITFPPPTVP